MKQLFSVKLSKKQFFIFLDTLLDEIFSIFRLPKVVNGLFDEDSRLTDRSYVRYLLLLKIY